MAELPDDLDVHLKNLSSELPEDIDVNPSKYMLGAPTSHDGASEEIQCICDTVKSQVEAKTNAAYDDFKAVSFTEQVVGGTLYNIKVHVGANKHITITVFRKLPCNPGPKYKVTKVKDEDQVVIYKDQHC